MHVASYSVGRQLEVKHLHLELYKLVSVILCMAHWYFKPYPQLCREYSNP